jgi:hypothetical protein
MDRVGRGASGRVGSDACRSWVPIKEVMRRTGPESAQSPVPVDDESTRARYPNVSSPCIVGRMMRASRGRAVSAASTLETRPDLGLDFRSRGCHSGATSDIHLWDFGCRSEVVGVRQSTTGCLAGSAAVLELRLQV